MSFDFVPLCQCFFSNESAGFMITFVNAKVMAEKNPLTFSRPSDEELVFLVVDDVVKVCAYGERFWCRITSLDGDMCSATVNNDLLTDKLYRGCKVKFHSDSIYAIYKD